MEESKMIDIRSSVAEYGVREISGKLKSIIEQNFGHVKIRGEISGLKIATSGHGYFSLKENECVLACICWRYALAKLKFKPEEGMQVVATGKITIYPGQSKYQLSIESLEADGLGALMVMLEKRRAMFISEGLFDDSRKKSLPFLPKRIGVITSLSGAVIRDIMHRIEGRCPSHVLIWPVLVQGETAADEVSKAIKGFNEIDDLRPDVIIVARGGGSIEDLWAFNEENVVRAAAASNIPLISAIGHETDYTLLDFVADLRAPTPTAAAEMAVPILSDLKFQISEYEHRMMRGIRRNLDMLNTKLEFTSKRLPKLDDLIKYNEQKLDHMIERVSNAYNLYIQNKISRLSRFNIENISLRALHKIDFLDSKLEQYHKMLYRALVVVLKQKYEKLVSLSAMIGSLNYKKVIQRGFAVARGENGKILSKKADFNKEFLLEVSDGDLKVKPLE